MAFIFFSNLSYIFVVVLSLYLWMFANAFRFEKFSFQFKVPSDSELDISIYNIWMNLFPYVCPSRKFGNLVLWLMAICVRGIENDLKSVWCFKSGNPPKQPPEIVLEFFSVKKKLGTWKTSKESRILKWLLWTSPNSYKFLLLLPHMVRIYLILSI